MTTRREAGDERGRSTIMSGWIVLADIECDWPDVFGPYVNMSEAREVEEKLSADSRVVKVEIQAIFDNVEYYLETLDEHLEP